MVITSGIIVTGIIAVIVFLAWLFRWAYKSGQETARRAKAESDAEILAKQRDVNVVTADDASRVFEDIRKLSSPAGTKGRNRRTSEKG